MGHKVITIDLPGMGTDKTPIKEVRIEKYNNKDPGEYRYPFGRWAAPLNVCRAQIINKKRHT